MDLGNGLGHLTYSTLVHPADNWEQLYHSLVTYLPKVKARIAGNKSFGVCIRLSASSAQTLAHSAAERDKLEAELRTLLGLRDTAVRLLEPGLAGRCL